MQKSAEICAFYEEKRGFSFNSCGKATDFYGLIFHGPVFLGLVFLGPVFLGSVFLGPVFLGLVFS